MISFYGRQWRCEGRNNDVANYSLQFSLNVFVY